MAVCFIGVVAIATSKDESAGADTYQETKVLGLCLTFTLAWVAATTNVLNRKMKTVHFSVISFLHACYGLSVSLIIITIEALVNGNGYRIYTGRQYGLMFLTAFIDTFALLSVTIAFQADSTGFVSIIGYMIVVYGFLADLFLFKQSITGIDLIGALLIFTTTVGIAIYKLRNANKAKSRSPVLSSDTSF